jgi:hypothetical protein
MFYRLLHWNIAGNKESFHSVIDKLKSNLPTFLCLNEVNNKSIRKIASPDIQHQGVDFQIAGGVKKSNILLMNFLRPVLMKVQFIGSKNSTFRHRIVLANFLEGNRSIKIINAHAPSGSNENEPISGSKIKSRFYLELLNIVKKEKPSIITMDANEPEVYGKGNINNMIFFYNQLARSKEIEAKQFFDYLMINNLYQLIQSKPTYKNKNFDHIFIDTSTIKIEKKETTNDLRKLHHSDHKPTLIRFSFK